MHRPLEGTRILEVGIFHAGPGGTAILADLGAEVIKVEQPGIGDPVRLSAYRGLNLTLPNGDNVFYEGANRNKKSITLDLAQPQGREIAYNLVKKCDVFFTNLRQSSIERLEMDYTTLSKLNPKLIYASVSSFGTRGPDANLGGFDYQGQGRAGFMYSVGEPDMPPLLLQFAVIDQATAVMASYEVVLALLMRDRFGIGQEVDVSLLGTTSFLMYFNYLVPLLTGHEVPRHARATADALRNIYQCQDGKWLILSESAREENWQTICDLLGLSELASDPRFSNRDTRMSNSSELVPMFNEAFARKPRGEWLRLFAEKDVVMCAVNTIWEAIDDPQMSANDYLVDSEHPDLGHIKIPGFPIKLSHAQVATTLMAPRLGEHTETVLTELGGYSTQEIAGFREYGVI